MKTDKICTKIKDKQIGLMLEKMQKDIGNFKIIMSEKDEQLHDLKIILKAVTISYQQVRKENIQLKQYITTIKQQQQQCQQQQQQVYFSRPKKYKIVIYEEASDSNLQQYQARNLQQKKKQKNMTLIQSNKNNKSDRNNNNNCLKKGT